LYGRKRMCVSFTGSKRKVAGTIHTPCFLPSLYLITIIFELATTNEITNCVVLKGSSFANLIIVVDFLCFIMLRLTYNDEGCVYSNCY